jgi:hypothetical protein
MWMQRSGQKAYNGGIDYGCPTGTPVYAAAPGVVSRAGQDQTGYGTHIRIQHADGYLTLYGHLVDILVGSGQSVTQGQVIGRSDNTGNSTGPHLHFELRKGTTPVDPQLYFGAQPEPEQPTTPGATPVIPGPLPRARVLVDQLNIRMGPGTHWPTWGKLTTGNDPEVISVKLDDQGNTWAQLGWQQWAAMQYDGNTYMRWI